MAARCWRIVWASFLLAMVVALAGCDSGPVGLPATSSSTSATTTPPPPPPRAPSGGPIKAEFDQEFFETDYSMDFSNPDGDILNYTWSGPDCGKWDAHSDLYSGKSGTFVQEWVHKHPPCGATTDHSDITITLTIAGRRSGRTLICTYQGAATGTGPPCNLL